MVRISDPNGNVFDVPLNDPRGVPAGDFIRNVIPKSGYEVVRVKSNDECETIKPTDFIKPTDRLATVPQNREG